MPAQTSQRPHEIRFVVKRGEFDGGKKTRSKECRALVGANAVEPNARQVPVRRLTQRGTDGNRLGAHTSMVTATAAAGTTGFWVGRQLSLR